MNGTPRAASAVADRAQMRHARRPAPRCFRPAACAPVRRSDPRRARPPPRGPQSAVDAIHARLALEVRCARRRWPGAARRCVRTSSASGNTRANTSLHQCTSAGAERKLRRSSSGCSAQSRRGRRRARSRSGPPRHCESRRWTASDRRPGTACGRRLRDQSCVSVQQQFVLVARGVLEFVDEDVPEARAEAFGQRRRRCSPRSAPGARRRRSRGDRTRPAR